MSAHDGEELKAGVVEVIAGIIEVEPTEIPDEETLTEVFDIDSLDLVDIVVGIEKKFGVRFPKEEAGKIRSVRQAVERLTIALEQSGV